jgi:CubicO group peptidase (beta-lactamase class C family)
MEGGHMMRHRAGLLIGMFLLWGLAVQAQEPDAARKKVDAVFADVARADTPGCALGVIRDGQLIFRRGYGQAVLEHGIAITPQTVFDIGSVSKHFTAAAIVLLAQQGKLSLDDDIRKYVPELPDYSGKGAAGQGGKAPRKLTIRHLLHHTGGVRNYDTMMALAAVDFSGRTGDKEALDYIVRQKQLNFPPGDEYLYSNSGYFLLSLVVKQASGKTLREFAAENIFQPLGMKDTQYLDDTTQIIPRRATGYDPREKGGFKIEMSGFEQTGDGAVQTTVEDFLLWDQNFYSGKVLGQQGLEWLQTPGTLNDGKKIAYAFGLQVSKYKGLPVVEHGGSWAGYRAHYLRFPERKFSVVTLCNVSNANPGGRARKVADAYLAGLLKEEAKPAASPLAANAAAASDARTGAAGTTAEDARKFTGIYRNPVTGGLRRVTFENGKLLGRFGSQQLELAPLGGETFRVVFPAADLRVRFAAAGAGKYNFVQEDVQEGSDTTFEPVEPFTPAPGTLRDFTGTFYSEEVDVTYTLFVNDGKLHLRIGKWSEMPLEPAFREAFSMPFGQLVFTRDAAGRVNSFNVQAGRVRDLRFTRRP